MPSAGVNKQHVVPGQHGRIGFDAGIVKLPIKHDSRRGKSAFCTLPEAGRLSVANRICRIVAGLLINASMC
jgi:hypothetical protein